MKNGLLLIFVMLLRKSWQIELPNPPASANAGTLSTSLVLERLFGNGDIYSAEHKETSEGHISSSMEDLLKLCEYEKSIQNEVSKLPDSNVKANYYQNLKADVILFAFNLKISTLQSSVTQQFSCCFEIANCNFIFEESAITAFFSSWILLVILSIFGSFSVLRSCF